MARVMWYGSSMTKPRKPAKATRKTGRDSKTGKFVIGAERFAKISAVEGIALTGEMRTRMGEFETRRMSAASRRAAIIRAYSKG
jgi:hypothetical protein